jgi:hypothetical protein
MAFAGLVVNCEPLAADLLQVQARVRAACMCEANERWIRLAKPHGGALALPVVALKDVEAVRVAKIRLKQVKDDVLRHVENLGAQRSVRLPHAGHSLPSYSVLGVSDIRTVASIPDIPPLPMRAALAVPQGNAGHGGTDMIVNWLSIVALHP